MSQFVERRAQEAHREEYARRGSNSGLTAEQTAVLDAWAVLRICIAAARALADGEPAPSDFNSNDVRSHCPALSERFPGGVKKSSNYIGTMLGWGTLAGGVTHPGLRLKPVPGKAKRGGRRYSLSSTNAANALRFLDRRGGEDVGVFAHAEGLADRQEMEALLEEDLPTHDELLESLNGTETEEGDTSLARDDQEKSEQEEGDGQQGLPPPPAPGPQPPPAGSPASRPAIPERQTHEPPVSLPPAPEADPAPQPVPPELRPRPDDDLSDEERLELLAQLGPQPSPGPGESARGPAPADGARRPEPAGPGLAPQPPADEPAPHSRPEAGPLPEPDDGAAELDDDLLELLRPDESHWGPESADLFGFLCDDEPRRAARPRRPRRRARKGDDTG